MSAAMLLPCRHVAIMSGGPERRHGGAMVDLRGCTLTGFSRTFSLCKAGGVSMAKLLIKLHMRAVRLDALRLAYAGRCEAALWRSTKTWGLPWHA